MDSIELSLLVNPHPCRHIVYPYNDETKAIHAVSLFAGSGLQKGEGVILIVADFRRSLIAEKLTADGLNLEALQKTGQLEWMSADEALGVFMPGGELDDEKFRSMMGRVIRRARTSAPVQRVRIFGEMVSLLLRRNLIEPAERLETLWNEVIETHSISLFCTYTLLQSGHSILPESLAKLHTHNFASWFSATDAEGPAGASAND